MCRHPPADGIIASLSTTVPFDSLRNIFAISLERLSQPTEKPKNSKSLWKSLYRLSGKLQQHTRVVLHMTFCYYLTDLQSLYMYLILLGSTVILVILGNIIAEPNNIRFMCA